MSAQTRRRSWPVARLLVLWLLSTATILLAGGLLSGVNVESPEAALGAAALLGILNALVWPVVLRFALPLTVLTLGLGVIVVNGAVVLLVAEIAPGLEVSSLSAGILLTIIVTVVNTAATSLFAIDDEGFWYRHVVARYGKRAAPSGGLDAPGLLFLEIDGLAHDVLVRAVRDGNAPTMARWMREGSHKLARWETDWSSQTGACQAGLLHGDNHDMPAFRWWEKDRGAAIVTNHPRDAAELERRRSNGRGLLFADGASRANILSGDAPHSLLTMSTVLSRERHGRIGQDYFAYFANPYNVTRTLVFVVREVISELWSAHRQRRLDVQPRIHRGFAYSLVRAWATVIQRDLQVNSIIADMYAGRPVLYTTFLAYDEVAHHSGIERHDALATLGQVDRQIGRVAAAAAHAPRTVSTGRALRPRPVAGGDLPRPLRDLAGGPRAAGDHGQGGRGRRLLERGARLPRRIARRRLPAAARSARSSCARCPRAHAEQGRGPPGRGRGAPARRTRARRQRWS